MDRSALKQEFSLAFLHAVATSAGCAFHPHRVDLDSVDATIAASKRTYACRPRLDLQVKCTDLGVGRAGDFSYPMKTKNYDDLREGGLHVPLILVVVTVPQDPQRWVEHRPGEMVLRECAYWTDCRTWLPTKNPKGVRVSISRTRPFNEQSLRAIMSQIEKKTF